MIRALLVGIALWSYPTKTTYTDPYTDIKAHCVQWTKYEDQMTEAHENSHQIHSEIRNRLGDGRNAFYVLENRVVVLSEPPIKLSEVAERCIPGKVYKLYLLDSQQWWNDQPLYLLDEMVAYTNGAIVGKAYKVDGWEFERDRAKELSYYAWRLCDLMKDRNLDDKDIRDFITWNFRRIP